MVARYKGPFLPLSDLSLSLSRSLSFSLSLSLSLSLSFSLSLSLSLSASLSGVGGAKADYIPELKNAPSDTFAMSICTVDGECACAHAPMHRAQWRELKSAHARTRPYTVHSGEN